MPSKYAPHSTRSEWKRSVDRLKASEKQRYLWEGRGALPGRDQSDLRKQVATQEQELNAVTPPDTDSAAKQQIKVHLAKLEEAMIEGREGVVPPMPTKAEMEEVPAGAVGKHSAWEKFWKEHNVDENGKVVLVGPKGRGAIFDWKDGRRTLFKDAEAEDPDIANLEILRPTRYANNSGGLADYTRRSYAGLGDAHARIFGTETTNELQQKIAEAEAAGTARIPRPEDIIAQPQTGCTYFAKSKGRVCGAPVIPGKDYCVGHSKQGRERDELKAMQQVAKEQLAAENAKMAAHAAA